MQGGYSQNTPWEKIFGKYSPCPAKPDPPSPIRRAKHMSGLNPVKLTLIIQFNPVSEEKVVADGEASFGRNSQADFLRHIYDL